MACTSFKDRHTDEQTYKQTDRGDQYNLRNQRFRKVNILNIHMVFLLCCGTYGQCITIATNFERKYGRQFSNVLHIDTYSKYPEVNLRNKTKLFVYNYFPENS